MHYGRAVRSVLHAHGFHEPTTTILPITGVVVDMQAPEALGAMIGVTVALYLGPTVLTDKVLDNSPKLSVTHTNKLQ